MSAVKIVLINPGSNTKYGLAYRLVMSKGIPLGIAYIAAVLEKSGIEVIIIDQNANEKSNLQIIEEIIKINPILVGFSCLVGSFNAVEDISAGLKKKITPLIVVGNVNPSVLPELYLNNNLADIVIRGEGEQAMLEIIQALIAEKSFEHIKGLSFRVQGNIVHNPDRQDVADLDKLPYPAHHLFRLNDYKDQLFFLRKGTILPVSVSRGCNYSCYFCSNRVVHKKLRIRNAEKIADEIEYFYNKFKVNTFGLVGAYFPINREHTLEFCEALRKRNLHNKIKWFTESRADKVDQGLLKIMRQSGLYFIMYGWDFATQRMSDKMNKSFKCEQIKSIIAQTAKQGIVSFAYFLVGCPGETEEDVLRTIKQAVESECTMAKFNVTLPYPGSKYFQEYIKDYPLDFRQLDSLSSWMDFSAINIDGLKLNDKFKQNIVQGIKMQRKAMFAFYFNPNTFKRAFFLLKYNFSLGFIFKAAYVMILLFWKNFTQMISRKGDR